jgi:hypothetical protein
MSNKSAQLQEIDSTSFDTLDSTFSLSDPFESSLEDNQDRVSLILSFDENNNEIKKVVFEDSLLTSCSISSSNISRHNSCHEASNNSYGSFLPKLTSTQQTNSLNDTSNKLFPCNCCFNCNDCLDGYRDFLSAINVSSTSRKSELDDTENRIIFKELFLSQNSINTTERSLNSPNE